ncbi:MAG: DUF4388 domain-containing protein [Acidobacteriota bacterium]
MSVCSNRRCAQPNAGAEGRCITCNSLLVGRLLRDRYLVKEMVSRGGFGATYMVNDQDCFDEIRILKELRPISIENDEPDTGPRKETAERLFKREAQTLLNLNHPGIPKLYAYFIQDGYSYLLQEYIPGRTLAEMVEQRKENYAEKEARQLLAELAEILRYLHSQQPPIVHRDIKPQNLMRHTDGRLLLIDFGAVCRAANPEGHGQTLIGSPGYAPPEQIMGQPVPQSDLYAAGATVVRLLTGRHPSQLTNKTKQRIEWTSHAAVSRPFCDLINELLVLDPNRRLGSAAELARWLRELAAVPPVVTGGSTPVQPVSADDATITAIANSDSSTGLKRGREISRLTVIDIITALKGDVDINAGTFQRVPVPLLLSRCSQSRVSGLLSCTYNGVTKTIQFDQGAIVFATSSLKEERLSEQLLKRGRLTMAEYERATQCVDETGQRMGTVLLQLGIISIEELTPLVIEHVSNLVYSTFEWIEGNYIFNQCAPPPEAIKMPFSTADIIFEGIRRLENLELIKLWLGDFKQRFRTTADPLVLYQTVKLYPREAFVASRIDSAMSIEELLSYGGLPEDETLRTVCGLLAIGMLEQTGEIVSGELAQSMPVGNVLTSPDPLPQDFDFSTAAAFCYEVESKLHSIENTDAYGILEISRQASDMEVADAYKTLARKFHPDRHSQLLNYNLSLRTDLEKIFQALASAFSLLDTREKRNLYNTLSRSGKFRIDTTTTRVAAAKDAQSQTNESRSASLAAKPLVSNDAADWLRRGQENYQLGQYEQARLAFERATELAPQVAEYHFQLARALAHLVGSFLAAEAQFYRTLELAPNNADYYAEFGLFYQRFSLIDRAERMFEQCLKLNPHHPVGLRSRHK